MSEREEAGRSPATDPFAEVRVIDSQLQHFSNYIDVIQVFKCRICSFCSPLEHVIASHMSEVHFPRRCYLCKQCLFVFEDRSQLISHLDSAHGTRSITVCFGESAPFVNSPPTWRAAAGRSSDDEALSRQSTDEHLENEARNGRVTSSTGNLANLPDDGQMERGNSGSSVSLPAEGEFLRGTPTTAECRQDQVQSRGSSCHPSTTDQDLEIVTDPNHAPQNRQDSSQEEVSRQESTESPEQPTRERQQVSENFPSRGNYIKTEPVSPVRSIFCPKRRRLLQASYSGESIEIDITDGQSSSENQNQSAATVTSQPPASSPSSHQNTSTETLNRGNVCTPVGRGGNSVGRHGRPESVLRGLLRRQETIEDMDAEAPNDIGGRKSSPLEVPASMPRSLSLTAPSTPRSNSDESTLPRQSSEPIVSHTPRYEEGQVPGRPQQDLPPVSEQSGRAEPGPKSMLHDLVSRVVTNDKRSDTGQRRSSEGNIFRKTGSIDETSSGQAPAPRSHRQRSYSISEGDTRGLPNGTNPDFQINQSTESNHEREPPPVPPTYPPHEHPRMPPAFWSRYPGLVYQPYNVESDPTKFWRSFPPFQAQASIQNEPPVPTRPNSEQNKAAVPGQVTEESFLYNYLRQANSVGPRHRRGSASMGSQQPGEGVPPNWANHSRFPEAGRTGMNQQRGVAWQHYHGGMPYHMLLRQNADDKSTSPNISSSTQRRLGIRPDMPMYHSLDRTASMQGGGDMKALERRRPPMLEHGGSSESSQELVQVDDITRQVQRAFGGTSGLYSTERAAIAWSDQSSGNSTSQDEPSGKDVDFKKRSRKSTFNIYREIPERKRKLDRDEEERIKSSYNADGSFDYFSLTGWKAYKCDLCKKRRFKTASELEEHKRRKHSLQHTHIGNASSSSSGIGASLEEASTSPQLTPQVSNG